MGCVGWTLLFIFLGILGLVLLMATASPRASASSAPRASREGPRPPSGRSPVRVPMVLEMGWQSSRKPPSIREALQESEACWVPAGQSREVQGFALAGGMLYVGSKLRGFSPWRATVDPALIDPALAARHRPGQPPNEELLPYWPSYSESPAEARGHYLAWLADGRRDPQIPIGFVFLFFYGLERRIFLDARHSARAREEVPGLLAEVERLLTVYGSHPSLSGYATRLLEAARLLHEEVDFAALRPPETAERSQLPLTVRLALGNFAKQGEPIPAEWARAWYEGSPVIFPRMAARRCPREFSRLFEVRYREAFPGGGLKVRPNKTRLTATYQPASAGFDGSVEIPLPDLPDFAALEAPLRKLEPIAEAVYQQLDAYSRWVGKTEDRESLLALGLLPAPLAREQAGPEARSFFAWIEERLAGEEAAAAPAAELRRRWQEQKAGEGQGEKFLKRDVEALVQVLGHWGYGVEPDPRFAGPSPFKAEQVVFFRLGEGGPEGQPAESGASALYGGGAVLLHLAAALSATDGDVSHEEERLLARHIETALQLPEPQQRRLRAHLRWLLAEQPSLAGVRKRLEGLPDGERRAVAQFLLTIAAADGRISPAEIKLLQRIYPWLGLAPGDVVTDLHSLASEAPPAAEPVTIRAASPAGGDFAIPRPADTEEAEGAFTLRLDPARLRAKQAETAAVASLLDGIFRAEEEEDEAAAGPAAAAPESEEAGLWGLDAAHSRLLRRLAAKSEWPREEVEAICRELGLLTDGALEVINEAAFEAFGDPLLEGEAVITLETDLLTEIEP